MIPKPGETAAELWDNTGYGEAIREQAARDGGLTGNDDPRVLFYHDVPPQLTEEAFRRERKQSSTPSAAPWPLQAWPSVRTHFVLCTENKEERERESKASRLRFVGCTRRRRKLNAIFLIPQ